MDFTSAVDLGGNDCLQMQILDVNSCFHSYKEKKLNSVSFVLFSLLLQ